MKEKLIIDKCINGLYVICNSILSKKTLSDFSLFAFVHSKQKYK